MAGRPAAGGGRWVEVEPERLSRWLAGFQQRHGPYTVESEGTGWLLRAGDGAVAALRAPAGASAGGDLDAFVADAQALRVLGLLLIRRGGYAAGIAEGDQLTASKVDSRYVQSRTAAGGWSQQRFARRREGQADALVREATELAVRLLLPRAHDLAALVAGGDRRLADRVLADPRLAPVAALRAERFLDVPDPKLSVLRGAVRAARTVRIQVGD